jgi:ankyrin repeat protein
VAPDDQLEQALLGPGKLEDVLAALEAGADVHRPFFDGTLALTWAISERFGPQGSAHCARAILGAGASVGEERGDETSVHRAAELGYAEALDVLLAADGAAAFGRFDSLGRSPLICAVMSRSREAALRLLEAGADPDASDEPRAGNPPLCWAAEARDERLVRDLLERGANPRKPGWMGLSALDRARAWRDSTRHPELKAIFELLERSGGAAP